jgi:hypothetical protein
LTRHLGAGAFRLYEELEKRLECFVGVSRNPPRIGAGCELTERLVQMKVTLVLLAVSVSAALAGCIAYPATVNGTPATVIQPAPVTVEAAPVVVEPAPVVYEPYPVVENGVTVMVDPEDYYYFAGGVYYHHHYLAEADVVVNVVPSGYHCVHRPIDIHGIPQKHFHHQEVYYHHHPEVRPGAHPRPPVKGRPIPEKDKRKLEPR